MRKLILEEWISIDGYAEDAQGKLDYFPTTDENRYADQRQLSFLDRIDTIVLGRKTYELFAEYWPAATTDEEIIADKLNEIPKVVFSKTLKSAPWGKWPAASVESGDAVDAIGNMKSMPGKDIILWGSISLAQTFMEADLVDQYRIQLCPTVVGGGRPLFAKRNQYKSMKLVDQGTTPSGIVYLYYERV